MSRLRNAWMALNGKLKPFTPPPTAILEREVIREVVVDVEDVLLYQIDSGPYVFAWRHDVLSDVVGRLYRTCAEAFAAIGPDFRGLLHVEEIQAVRVGERFFRKSSEIQIAPKPKVVKGKKGKAS